MTYPITSKPDDTPAPSLNTTSSWRSLRGANRLPTHHVLSHNLPGDDTSESGVSESIPEKRCLRCGEFKSIFQFRLSNRAKADDDPLTVSRRAYCRPCRTAMNAPYKARYRLQKYQPIIRLLAEHGPLCTASIAEKLGLSFMTVKNRCAHMTRRGLLHRTPRIYYSSIYAVSDSAQALFPAKTEDAVQAALDAPDAWLLQVQQQAEARRQHKAAMARW